MTVADDDPILIAHEGKLKWLCPGGRLLPYVAGGDDPDPPEKTFTQADVDRIVQDRLGRVKPEPPADYAELQAAKKRLDELETAGKTEVERATAQITTLTSERDAAHAARDQAITDAKNERLRAAIVSEAAKQKAVDPDDVFALLPKDAVTIGDDGQVTGAEGAVKALLEAKPHLVGSTTPPRPKPDAAQGNRSDETPSVKTGSELWKSRHAKAGAST